jgi:hypothetical protein
MQLIASAVLILISPFFELYSVVSFGPFRADGWGRITAAPAVAASLDLSLPRYGVVVFACGVLCIALAGLALLELWRPSKHLSDVVDSATTLVFGLTVGTCAVLLVDLLSFVHNYQHTTVGPSIYLVGAACLLLGWAVISSWQPGGASPIVDTWLPQRWPRIHNRRRIRVPGPGGRRR